MGYPELHKQQVSSRPSRVPRSRAGMSFADYETEFRELCEHAEADLNALRAGPGGAPNTRGILKQVEYDLKEAAVQIKNMEVSASDHSSRTQAASPIKGYHSKLARLCTDLERATREGLQPASTSQNRQSLFSYPHGSSYQASGSGDLENGQQMERLLKTREKQEETSRRLE